jgi:hypothetical protein
MWFKAAAFSVIVFAIFIISEASSYAFSNFNVKINGSSVTIPPTPGDEVAISSATPYGCFTISGLDGTNPAKVIGDESAPDFIQLQNVKIRANSASCTGNILFYATFNQPQLAQNVLVTAERYAGVGYLKRTPATGSPGSWFKVTGWMNDLDTPGDNEVGTWQQKTATATSYNFNFTKSENWLPPSLLHDRVMKVQFWFSLSQANDYLELPVVRVRTLGGGAIAANDNDNSVANPVNDQGVSSGDSKDCDACPWWKQIFLICDDDDYFPRPTKAIKRVD